MGTKSKPAKPAPRPPETLLSELGDSRPVWDQLLSELADHFQLTTYEWKGESLRVKKKDRTILYMLPSNGTFRVAFVLGDRAVAATRQVSLPPYVVRTITGARRYAEGTGFRLQVSGPEDLPAILALTRIKLEN